MTEVEEVLLVRHAATAWSGIRYSGRSDPWLSPAGRAQALELGDAVATRVRAGAEVAIVSSPARRARQTARAIERALRGRPDVQLQPHLRFDPRWAEVDVGAVDGLTFQRIERRWPELAASLAEGDPAIDWPGGERAATLEARVRAAWADVWKESASTVIVVTHAGPLRLAIAVAESRDPADVPFEGVGGLYRVLRSGP
jgi:broad specificity phosphatase PhoE